MSKPLSCWFGLHDWTVWMNDDESEVFIGCRDCGEPDEILQGAIHDVFARAINDTEGEK